MQWNNWQLSATKRITFRSIIEFHEQRQIDQMPVPEKAVTAFFLESNDVEDGSGGGGPRAATENTFSPELKLDARQLTQLQIIMMIKR